MLGSRLEAGEAIHPPVGRRHGGLCRRCSGQTPPRRTQGKSRPHGGGLDEHCRDIDPLLGRCREELYACRAGHSVLTLNLKLAAAASLDKKRNDSGSMRRPTLPPVLRQEPLLPTRVGRGFPVRRVCGSAGGALSAEKQPRITLREHIAPPSGACSASC